MTPDDIARALAYRISELRVLSDALGGAVNTALSKNIRLDDPAVAHLPFIRAYVDGAIALLDQGQTYLNPGADRTARLAADFEEMEGTDGSVSCPEIDRAADTQSTVD